MTRVRAIVVTLFLIFLAQQSFAESDNIKTWHNVISDSTDTGTLGGVSISLSEEYQSNTMAAEEWPHLIEVYTATWCENCVQTEAITNSLSTADNESIMQIHYHRFIAETQDPFGSQETDDRWVERYGQSSMVADGYERIAPSNVFDGERLHTGTSPVSDSLENDYQTSLETSPSIEYSDFIASLDWSNESGTDTFSWNISTPSLSESYTISPKLFFIEDVGYFPEGGNGEEYYHHILRDVVDLSSQEGEISIDYNPAYDGDDLSVILVFDWHYNNDEGFFGALPFPNLIVFISLFMAALHSRKDN
ncbi:hypothetical protein N8809_00110 [Euryarchaeota archaeon]|nr:hypothetical protein [Euryarchaeota archaeon]